MSTAPNKSGKDWARELINLYSEGYSDAEVAAEMKITIREYMKQVEENPTFAKLVEFGRTLSLAWWEGQARRNLGSKQFNTPLWVFNMKNKFGWADKVETRSEIENTTISLDELRAKVAKQTYDYIKRNSPELSDAQRLLQFPEIETEVQDESSIESNG